MKKLLKFIPEIYFMGLGIFWVAENYFASGTLNYIALLLVWLLFLQFFYKNRILGLIYGVLLGFTSAFMILAVNSEVGGFETFTEQALQLQLVGWGVFGTGLIMAGTMVYKFATVKVNYDEESVLTVTY
ncbi:hypothetical protein HYN59_09105 [Flavobacterium album]|uniref:Uncharacterized protein n=1 Tax=Flavobacterium album TaxID=2175091 RepID=A0A2S1QY03_9FLAO|nr:hypothetical protein [Flavobacterium album]AWH85265.1 hypothetical protein HYN59_09105 [Flavobacterium album]